MAKTIEIPDRIEQMTTADGFYRLWLDNVQSGMTYVEAYQDLENEYTAFMKKHGLEPLVGTRRYASYDSFRHVKRQKE